MKKIFSYKIISWAVLLCAYSFLAYKLIHFDNYREVWLSWKNAYASNSIYLLFVLLLLPLNWFLEIKKWQFLIRKVQHLSLPEAFKSVMIGNTAAFFTPNRIGEFPGRSLSLAGGKKLQGITVGILGSIAQTLTIMLFGLPAAALFFTQHQFGNNSNSNYLYTLLFIVILLLALYFLLPYIAKKLKKQKLFRRIEQLLESITQIEQVDLVSILFLSILRYLVFCAQFFFLLHFFGVELNCLEGMIAIATNYLFITFTPSLAFSEGAIRSSIAILVIGVYAQNVVGIAAAGISIWLINFVLPMAIGSLVLGKETPNLQRES